MLEYPYHLSVKIISRSKGHNTIAAAAYRSGQRIQVDMDINNNNQKPVIYDYTRRHGVMSSFMMAPANAPAWATDRSKVWNRVEKAEIRKDSQLAREIVVSLPCVDIFNNLNENNKSKRLKEFYEKLLKRYVNDNFVKEGMVADVSLHEPAEKNDERNFHAHIMLSMRRVFNDNADCNTGFGQKERGWNSPARLEGWRKSWSLTVNNTLKSHKIDAFIDHRTYEERGLDIGATTPIGSHNHKLEARGVKTIAGNDNRKVKAANKADHKYLEKLFEHSLSVPEHELLNAIEKAGYENPEAVREALEKDGTLIPLYSRETGLKSGLWSFDTINKRANFLKEKSQKLHKRSHYDLPVDVIQKITKKRNDKKVRAALNYAAQPQGFKVIEAKNNGHKNTFLSSLREMYMLAGYDVIAVARTNEGKGSFRKAGFTKGVLTYRDFLRRFGERYKGVRSNKKKILLFDDADQLSPLQDKEIFKMAEKLDAKLIYIGDQNNKKLRQSMFPYYRILTVFKSLKRAFKKAQSRVQLISKAFADANIYKALTMQKKRFAKYINSYTNAAQAKQGILDEWFSKIKKKRDNRFILTASDKDAQTFNFAIQKKRLEKKHLAARYGKAFSVAYPSDKHKTLRRDLFVYWGEQIQFKKSYKALGIENGTRATVRIHYLNHSVLELDDGRLIDVDLRETNGFDLGYAGRVVSLSETNLDQGYIYHSKANALDDAPLLYQHSKLPVRLFYANDIAPDLESLSSQLLGRRHDLCSGFYDASENAGDQSDSSKDDDNDNLITIRENVL